MLCGNHGDGIACVDVEAAGTAVPDIAAAVQATRHMPVTGRATVACMCGWTSPMVR